MYGPCRMLIGQSIIASTTATETRIIFCCTVNDTQFLICYIYIYIYIYLFIYLFIFIFLLNNYVC